MGSLSTYLADRFSRNTRTTGGRTYRETLDDTLLEIIHRDLDEVQRIELPLVSIRAGALRADPLLTAYSTDDDVYVRETIERYVSDAFSPEGYSSLAGLIDHRISSYGARHARLIQRLDERLGKRGPLSGARFYRDVFEDAYRGQFELSHQRADLARIETEVRSKEPELGAQAPIRTLNTLFARADPFLEWVHDALIDYHEFRFTAEALEERGAQHLSANSDAHLVDHLARESLKRVLSSIADITSRPLEREIFPGDEVEPLTR